MTAEPKSNRIGHGWHVLTQEEESQYMTMQAGPFKSLQIAERELKKVAQQFDGQTVILAKIQRKVKVKVETKSVVTFE